MGFVTLYVREAHPAENVDQPERFEDKLSHARAYQAREGIDWPVAVDDLDGSLHRRLGPADTGYAMGVDGRVAARMLWAADAKAVREALEAAADGETIRERRTRVLPLAVGASELLPIFDLAGPRAARDAVKVMPPMYLAGIVAQRLPRWSPLARGVTAAAVSGLVHIGAIGALWALANRIRRR